MCPASGSLGIYSCADVIPLGAHTIWILRTGGPPVKVSMSTNNFSIRKQKMDFFSKPKANRSKKSSKLKLGLNKSLTILEPCHSLLQKDLGCVYNTRCPCSLQKGTCLCPLTAQLGINMDIKHPMNHWESWRPSSNIVTSTYACSR